MVLMYNKGLINDELWAQHLTNAFEAEISFKGKTPADAPRIRYTLKSIQDFTNYTPPKKSKLELMYTPTASSMPPKFHYYVSIESVLVDDQIIFKAKEYDCKSCGGKHKGLHSWTAQMLLPKPWFEIRNFTIDPKTPFTVGKHTATFNIEAHIYHHDEVDVAITRTIGRPPEQKPRLHLERTLTQTFDIAPEKLPTIKHVYDPKIENTLHQRVAFGSIKQYTRKMEKGPDRIVTIFKAYTENIPQHISFDIWFKHKDGRTKKSSAGVFVPKYSNSTLHAGLDKSPFKIGEKVDVIYKPNGKHTLSNTTDDIQEIWGKEIVFKDILIIGRKDLERKYKPYTNENPISLMPIGDLNNINQSIHLTSEFTADQEAVVILSYKKSLKSNLSYDVYIKFKDHEPQLIQHADKSPRPFNHVLINGSRHQSPRFVYKFPSKMQTKHAFDIILKPNQDHINLFPFDAKLLWKKPIVFRNIKPQAIRKNRRDRRLDTYYYPQPSKNIEIKK